jgi:hypothetical protein
MLYRNLSLTLLALITACTTENTEPQVEPPSAAAATLALASDPGKATGIVATKAAGPNDDIIVEGRVFDITKGYAVMKLMDLKLDYCGEINKEEKCPTPWDYCCDPQEERIANSLLVEARGADGNPLATPSLPNTRLLDKVKVVGKVIVDEHGNSVLLAKGIFQAERPDLPGYVKWPR